MRVKINTPAQFEYKNMWIVFGFTSVLLVGGLIAAFVLSNGQPDVAWQALKEFLNESKQDGDLRGYISFIAILAGICIGPFASGAAIFYYSRRKKKEDHFTAMDFSDTGLTLENTDPKQSFFTPYSELSCRMEVTTYIRRGPKGQTPRCIDNITLIFYTPQGPQTIKQVGAMPFIRKILDVAGRFSFFTADVRSLNGLFNSEEKDLAQYVKEQIHNYRTYGKMLRFSDSQRSGVRLMGYILMGISIFFLLGSLDLCCALWHDALYNHDGFSLGAALLLSAVLSGIFATGARMWYLAHQDDKLAKDLCAKRRP